MVSRVRLTKEEFLSRLPSKNIRVIKEHINYSYKELVQGLKMKELFTNLPVENDASVAIIYMFKPFSDIAGTYNLEITGKDFNKAVQTIAKTAYKTLSNSLKKEFSSKKATLVFPDEDWNNLVFVYANWSKTDQISSKISEVFDWSTAQIGIKINSEVNVNYYSQPKNQVIFRLPVMVWVWKKTLGKVVK